MSGAEQPTVVPFKYLLVPCDDKCPVEQRTFAGASDDELREVLTSHFRRTKLSIGQKQELAATITARAVENNKKSAVGPAEADSDPAASVATMHSYAEDFADHTSFEIVPVVMPTRATKFVGTSLYIDDAGRFKDLPVNSRASRIAQRDIRGDAFMLSNHDDPALDEWRRMDCTADDFQTLFDHPPETTLDTSNQAAMASETMKRESEAKKISREDAERGLKAKADGNALFASGDVKAAIQAYSEAIDLLEGRRDLHENAAELDTTRCVSFLNRSLCNGKLGRWSEAAKDALEAVHMDPASVKGYFRLANARCNLKEFDEALNALKACEMTGGVTTETEKLRSDIEQGKSTFLKDQKAKFSKMFA